MLGNFNCGRCLRSGNSRAWTSFYPARVRSSREHGQPVRQFCGQEVYPTRDTRTAKVTATWPIDECESPHSRAIDSAPHRLCATCVNAKMLVGDSTEVTWSRSSPSAMGASERRCRLRSNPAASLQLKSRRYAFGNQRRQCQHVRVTR